MKGKRVLFGVCCMVCTMLVSGCGAEKENAGLPAADREEVDGTEIYKDILDDFFRLIANGTEEDIYFEGSDGVSEALWAMEGKNPLNCFG